MKTLLELDKAYLRVKAQLMFGPDRDGGEETKRNVEILNELYSMAKILTIRKENEEKVK